MVDLKRLFVRQNRSLPKSCEKQHIETFNNSVRMNNEHFRKHPSSFNCQTQNHQRCAFALGSSNWPSIIRPDPVLNYPLKLAVFGLAIFSLFFCSLFGSSNRPVSICVTWNIKEKARLFSLHNTSGGSPRTLFFCFFYFLDGPGLPGHQNSCSGWCLFAFQHFGSFATTYLYKLVARVCAL